MTTPTPTTPKTLVSNEYITLELRDITHAEAPHAGIKLASAMDTAGAAKGSPEAQFYWTSRTSMCINNGFAVGVFQSGANAPTACALALVDNMDASRVVVDGYMVPDADFNYTGECIGALVEAVKAWATSLGRTAGTYTTEMVMQPVQVRTFHPLP